MNTFFSNHIEDKLIFLSEIDSKHAIKVLRMTNGDRCFVVNGNGERFTSEVVVAHQKKTELKILETHTEVKKHAKLHIAIAPTKNIDRFEWFLEKATEIGIDEITPILSENSERKIIKHERLEKVLISAMKQSQQLYLPKLNPLTSLKEIFVNATEKQKYIAHCEEHEKKYLGDAVDMQFDTLILIGPEGDFSSVEIENAKKTFTPVSLGFSRLRTETAGVYATSIISYLRNNTKQ